MRDKRRPWRRVLIWAVGILLFIQALNLIMPARIAPVGPFNLLARAVIASSAALRTTTTLIQERIDRYFDNADAVARLQRLERENQDLRFQVDYLDAYIHKRQALDELLGWTYKPWQGAVARVVFHDPMDRYSSAWIRVPKNAMVEGHAVINSTGLVGRIVAQAGRSAQVLLINDVANAVDAETNTGVRVLVRGTGTIHGRLDFVPRYEPLTSGDALWTTGRDGIYPAGILVGFVDDIARESEQLYLDADVRYAVDIASIDWVRTVPFSEPGP